MAWAWVGLLHRAAPLLCQLLLRWPLLRLSFTLLKDPCNNQRVQGSFNPVHMILSDWASQIL